jgi:hypothetical protein
MRNLLLIGLIPLLLMACTSEGKYSKSNTFDIKEECGDAGTWVRVHYGDSQLKVKPKVHLKKGSAWEFRLKPKIKATDPVDYNKMEVTILGKKSDPDASWIDISGTFEKSGGSLVLCVDPDQKEDLKTYEYFVHVEEIGTLDPRADVEK